MNVVIVESPAKAKTINKYLGSDYKVLASYGHVRDLPPKDGSVRPDKDFEMDWEVDDRAQKRMKEIADAVKGSAKLILATDPDREGEAISWHILEVLQSKGVLKGVDVERVVFNAITKSAVAEGMAHPRKIDQELVDAYLARRALDYLVGFTLSPVLWRKLPGSRSAGRVQSVALRLICDRELEIETFKPQEYWSVDALLRTPDGAEFQARLSRLNGEKIEKFTLDNEASAKAAEAAIRAGLYSVSTVDAKPAKRNPPPPFITSTLQQEASRKLGFSASRTMQVAQRLYEGVEIGGETVGLITYMRTDGVDLAPEAVADLRNLIQGNFGQRYLPPAPRLYKSRAKNAQEAHEAIRPANPTYRPEDVAGRLEPDLARLYELIWKRTVACQMEAAEFERTTVDIVDGDGKVVLRANGSVQLFDGFLTLYQEGRDDAGEDEDGTRLPKMAAGDRLNLGDVKPEQHFTEPPPRYSEASLVKRMEELGIGRPSTYASILTVLRDRGYVRMDRNRFIPDDKGRILTTFLEHFFGRYVEYDFTADLEEKLDLVSAGELGWKQLLADFWREFIASVKEIGELRITNVIDALDATLEPHLFPKSADGNDPRKCPSCADGRLSLKLGRFGAFVGCSNYPECKFTRPLAVPGSDGANNGPRTLGKHPDTGEDVTVRVGRFGPYVQLGEAKEGEKPKRSGIPRTVNASDLTLERALELLQLPREVGKHPETAKPIVSNLGRFGPYVSHDGVYANLESLEDVFTIGLNHAVMLLAEKAARGPRAKPGTIRELGKHPDDDKPVVLMKGKFGPYVAHGKTNATLPRDSDLEKVTLEEALPLLAERAAKTGGGPRRKAKAPAKKTAARKAPPAAKPAAAVAAKAAAKPAAKSKATKPKAPKRVVVAE